jgi:hypothetical protein
LIGKPGTFTVKLSDKLRELLAEEVSIAITLENRSDAPRDVSEGKLIGVTRLSKL